MIDRHSIRVRGRGGEFTLPGAESHYPPDLELEPEHLDIALRVEIRERRVAGTVTHTLRARSAGQHRLVLHAVGFEDVSVTAPNGGSLRHGYDGREIRIDWDDPFEDGETREVAVTYQVENPVTGLYFSAPSDTYPDAPLYAASDHETERARHWLPTIDLPNARPTVAFHLRADAALTVLANGTQAGEEQHDDGTKTVHWTLEQPCPSYLTCFCVGDLIRFDAGDFEGRPLAWFTTPAFTPEDLDRSFGRTHDMLTWMAEKLDHPFPYPKYFQFALPDYGGAMENISLVAWDDMFVLDETMAREWTWLVDQINVHEMAHSYFGDMVVCRDYAHAWLKESWATYVETLWLEDSLGDDEARYDVFSNIDAYTTEADEAYMRPLVTRTFNHSWQMYDRHLYPGGAARLHMLRCELGDTVFFRGVHAYLKRFAHKVVETSDFRRCMEEASGRSLGKWFDQWIHTLGYPRIKATWAWDPKQKAGTWTLEQTQEDKKKGVPVFELPIELGWVLDGELQLREVRLDKAKHVVVIPMEKEPEQVRIDPRGRTVMKLELNPSDEMLRRQLTEAKDVVGRILAARELCKTGKAQNIEAVHAAYVAESFWGVRIRMAQALADCGTQPAVDALADLVGREDDGMVLAPLLRAAATLRARALRDAVMARLDEGIDLYWATSAAYGVLGAQRDDAPYELLAAAAARRDRYGFEQAGALRALAGTRRPEAEDLLIERAAYGATSGRARPAALGALGTLAAGLERRPRERAVETLVDLLRDPEENVRFAAVDGLGATTDPRAIPALTAHRAGLSDQDRIRVDKAVQRLRAAAKPKAPALEKALDEVREKLRKLDDRLGKLEGTQSSEP